MLQRMRYRLALDLGSTSIGWALIRLNKNDRPCAIIKVGVRIFSSGRNPKDGSSLAVTRRKARSMRRQRDRLLKRKARMMRLLIEHGFFPADETQRKKLEVLNPYSLRAKGLDEPLTPSEFGRALFHICQRRGFKSNRKTDKKENDSSALKSAIKKLHAAIDPQGNKNKPRTVGELLFKRLTDHSKRPEERTVRARYRQQRHKKEDGKTRIEKYYDLYIDRTMIEQEFDALWKKQAILNPIIFTETARIDLKDALLHQRPLLPVKPGRCTLIPEEERAPLALPSTQRFRIYQEVNNLRLIREGLKEEPLTITQRNNVVIALEKNAKQSFAQIKKLLGLGGSVQFNFEDPKRKELKGNTTSAILSKNDHFGPAWFNFDDSTQDKIVWQLVKEENETKLIRWLQEKTGIHEKQAETIANAGLPEGYGSLCEKALVQILPELRRNIITYSKAVQAAGFDHHSNISCSATGEVLPELPYYGNPLQRHVGFGSGKSTDSNEKRYGRIANPTVHIGLNQIRLVINTLIRRYGHPSEVIVEIARELKQSKTQRDEAHKKQAGNQDRNQRIRTEIAGIIGINEERVRRDDIQKMILWEELSFDIADRKCPYSGIQIGKTMLLSDEVEIEHILPFSQTLDDSLNNKTVSLRQANRIKGNRTPWDARHDFSAQGWHYKDIEERAEQMPMAKRYRFSEDGLKRWQKDDACFLARALNDTRYLSRIAREYVSLICPRTRVIPGQMTAILRKKFALNNVLGLNGEKNRNDHRHHAVDACVIGVTDQGLLQRFAKASANARGKNIGRLVENMPLPWDSYQEHVKRAINSMWVSHKPDHSHEGAMHNDTAYGLLGNGKVRHHKIVEGQRERIEDNLSVIEISDHNLLTRHGSLPDGNPRPYKGYKGDSNYCIEIVRNEKGKWEGHVVSTFDAYQLARIHGPERLKHPSLSANDKPLVMRLIRNDLIRIEHDGTIRTLRICTIRRNGTLSLADIVEANVDARVRNKEMAYISKTASSLQKAKARRISISPIGVVNDPGFKG